MLTRTLEGALRRLVIGTSLEGLARFVWKKVLRQRTKNDVYDVQTLAIMRRVVGPESTCVDVGCHKGSMLDAMLELAPRGVHYAFEPLPELFRGLRDRYARYANVILSNVALSDSAGTSTFHANRDHPGFSGMRRRDYPSERDRVDVIEVGTDRLDAIIPGGQRIAFIKIDVEGAEFLVLRGGREHLRRDRPVVVFEHGQGSRTYYGVDSGRVFDLLEECGLRVSLLMGFLDGGSALNREEMIHQVEDGLNYYFVAHP